MSEQVNPSDWKRVDCGFSGLEDDRGENEVSSWSNNKNIPESDSGDIWTTLNVLKTLHYALKNGKFYGI